MHLPPRPRASILIVIAFFLLAAIAPARFTMLAPAKAREIFPSLVSYKGAVEKPKPNGNYYLLTISITDPNAPIPGVAYLVGWLRGDVAVYPTEALFPKGKSFNEVERENIADMKRSQNVAAATAISYVERKFAGEFGEARPRYDDIAFDIKKVGGPSAGLIFSLSIIDLLTKEDLLQGRKIAATGTIDARERVGAIGGVQEKLISVARAGIKTVLVPRSNCRDIASVPKGVEVVPVSTLDEAVTFLLGKTRAKPCINLGA